MDFRSVAANELSAIAIKLADAAQQQTEAATASLNASFQTAIEKLRADHAQTVNENDRLTAENAALSWEKDELVARAGRDRRGPTIERLVETFDLMSLGTSVDDVVIAATSALETEFARVAVFTPREGRFESPYGHGFDRSSLSDAAQAFIDQASRSGGLQRVPQEGAPATSPFGGSPTMVVTAPVVVRGDVLAVMYADNAGQPDDNDTLKDAMSLMGVLCRHAVLALERLTIELKAIAELRAYAKMLLDEVEYVYDADLAAKMPPHERQTRMQENLRCAKQIYRQRVTLEGPAAAAVLDEVIARAIDEKRSIPFGQDLSVAVASDLTVPVAGA